MTGLKLAFRVRRTILGVHRRACLFDLHIGIGYLFVVHLLFFLEKTESSAPQKTTSNQFKTDRKLLEPFLHFCTDDIALLIRELGKLGIYVRKHVEDIGAGVECIASHTGFNLRQPYRLDKNTPGVSPVGFTVATSLKALASFLCKVTIARAASL